MFGFRMTVSDDEQYHVRQLFASAMDHRAPVRVSFFKQLKDEKHRPVFSGGRPLFVKVTRVVEPHAFGVTKAGDRVVKVVDRTPEGELRPEYRTIRLDRVAVSRSTGKVLATRLLTQGYLCPTLLDFKPLHPTKRVLSAA
jgi:hypothetical protein